LGTPDGKGYGFNDVAGSIERVRTIGERLMES